MKTIVGVVLALCFTLPMAALTVTLGTTMNVSATINQGSVTLSVSNTTPFAINQQIAIPGLSGLRTVTAIGVNLVILNSPADNSVANAAVRLVVDSIEHSSLRVLWTTDSPVYGSVSFGVASNQYPYRTYETSGAQSETHISLGGLQPSTQYFLRVNAKPSPGLNTSGICNTDSCGATEITVTTLQEPVIHPAPPAPPATFNTTAPDTTGYTIFPVPAFSDGLKTGTILAGSNVLVVNNSSGMAPNHWIVIQGTSCSLLAPYLTMPAFPGCKIQSVSGNTVTLTSTVSQTAANAPVSWALYTIQDMIIASNPNRLTYGTVFEWAQGYKGIWYPVFQSYGPMGLRLDGLPPDDNPNCAEHPCSLSDPAHRWIVFRTASGPGLLPPTGVQTGPLWAPVLGAIVAQSPNITLNGGEALYASDGTFTTGAHHYRIENLEITTAPVPDDSTDPRPFATLVYWDATTANQVPNHMVLDRVYIHSPSTTTRVFIAGLTMGGASNALLNSYIGPIDFWHAYAPLSQPCSISGSNLIIPAQTYQQNEFKTVWTLPAPVTATLSAQSSYTGNFIAYLQPGGSVGISYSPGSASLSCSPNCSTSPVAGVTTDTNAPVGWPYNSVKICSGTIANNALSLTIPLYQDSYYTIEGSNGIQFNDGPGPYVFTNNYIEGYGESFFIDSSGSQPAIPSDVTFSRNYLYWNQNHRINSPTSNGFVYVVRNLFEIKRGKRWNIVGNLFEGEWAQVNQGSTILLSGRQINAGPAGEGISDIAITNNTIRNGAAPFYCQGGSPGLDPPLTTRVSYLDNLTYGMNGFTYQYNPSTPYIGETFRILYGCQDVSAHHNTTYYPIGTAPWQVVLGNEIWSEGLAFVDNILYLSSANSQSGIAADPTQTAYPFIPAIRSGISYQDTLNSFSVRIGASVQPNYTFSNNVIIAGTIGDTLASQTDISSSQFQQTYIPQYGSLAAAQLFPAGDTRAAREANVNWVNPAAGNFQLNSGSSYAGKGTDGLDIGLNMTGLTAAQGTISSISATTSGGSTTVTFSTPDVGTSCWVAYGQRGAPLSSYTLSSADNSQSMQRSIAVPGLNMVIGPQRGPDRISPALAVLCNGTVAQLY